jgi:hypothetical protein
VTCVSCVFRCCGRPKKKSWRKIPWMLENGDFSRYNVFYWKKRKVNSVSTKTEKIHFLFVWGDGFQQESQTNLSFREHA